MTRRWGVPALSLWLILSGLIPLLNVRFSHIDTIMALLAVAAGVLLLFRK